MSELMLENNDQSGRPLAAFLYPRQDRLPFELPQPAPVYALKPHIEIAVEAVQPASEQLTFLPPQDFEFEDIGKPSTIEISGRDIDIENVLRNMSVYETIAGKEDELTVKEEIVKHLARIAITTAFIPLVHERYNPILPNGLYRIGDHTYRRDKSGVYIVRETFQGTQAYLALASFEQPLGSLLAGSEDNLAFAKDMLKDAQIRENDIQTETYSEPPTVLQDEERLQTQPLNRPKIKLPEFDQETAAANRERQEALRQANGAFAHAHLFWLTHRDLLPENVGRIMSINQTPNRGMTTEIIDGGNQLILYFDARSNGTNGHMSVATYTWRLKSIDIKTRSSTKDELIVEQGKTMRCERTIRDSQQRFIRTIPYDPIEVMYKVLGITMHNATKGHIRKLRERLDELREQVINYALLSAEGPSAKPYWQADSPSYTSELDRERSKLHGATFVPESGTT